MTQQSNGTLEPRKAANSKLGKPSKPYPDFPLFPHATGRWAKKIRGKTHYFGKWADPNDALELYLEQRDDLHAGRAPRAVSGSLALSDLVNKFLTSKQARMNAKEAPLSPRTFSDYHRVCAMLIEEFGGTRAVIDIHPMDFERFHMKLAAKYSLTALGRQITMSRSVFKYGVDNDLIDKVVKFGSSFKVPSKIGKRKERARTRQKHGKRMFEATEIRAMLKKASIQLKAMILLGCNGGLGNTDIACLPLSALDGDWLNYPREKNGINHRIPLWPETVAALSEVIEHRREPNSQQDADILFLTKYRQRWVRFEVVEVKRFGKSELKTKQDDAIAKETAKLLRALEFKRKGVGFYALRHTFKTIAGGSKDQVAVDHIMGHIDDSMAETYREVIDDDRLQAVANHVRDWLKS